MFTAISRYYPNKPAYQNWEESVNNLTVHKHNLDIRQADDRHEIFIESLGPKTCRKKSFSTLGKKKNFPDCSKICPSGLRTYKKKKLIFIWCYYHLELKSYLLQRLRPNHYVCERTRQRSSTPPSLLLPRPH